MQWHHSTEAGDKCNVCCNYRLNMHDKGGGHEVQASPSHCALAGNTTGPTKAVVESCCDNTLFKEVEIKALPQPWIQAWFSEANVIFSSDHWNKIAFFSFNQVKLWCHKRQHIHTHIKLSLTSMQKLKVKRKSCNSSGFHPMTIRMNAALLLAEARNWEKGFSTIP